MQKKSLRKSLTARSSRYKVSRRGPAQRAKRVCPEPDVREKNIDLIRKEFTDELDMGLEFFERKVSKLYKGVFGFFANPMVRFLYRYLGVHEAEKKGLKRVNFFLDILRNFDGDITSIVDGNFERFLDCNEAWLRRNPNHPKIHEFKKNLRDEFKSQVEIYAKMVGVRGDTYGELVRQAYPERVALDKLLEKQFKIINRQFQLVEQESGLIKIPQVIRKEVLSLTKLGYDYTQKRIGLRLDEIYDRGSQSICAGGGFGMRTGRGGEQICWRRRAPALRT